MDSADRNRGDSRNLAASQGAGRKSHEVCDARSPGQFREEYASRLPDRTRTDSLRAARASGPGRANRSGGTPREGSSR
jgi:hypothetical protein